METRFNYINRKGKLKYGDGLLDTINIYSEIDKTGEFQYFSDESLNESFSFNIFKDCRTYQEKKDKLIHLIKSGMITLGTAMALISIITPNKAAQEQIKQEVVEVSTGAKKSSQIEDIEVKPSFDKNVEFAKQWKMSKDGKEHIKKYETFSPTPYFATANDKEKNIRTIGYGHVIKEKDPEWLKNAKSITKEEALDIFNKDVSFFENYFENNIVPRLNKNLQTPEAFPQVMIDMAISMMYNSGNGNFKKESINPFYTRLKNCRLDKDTDKIDKTDYDFTIAAIPNSLIYHNGEIMKGLQNRRQTEYKIAAQAK